MNLKDNFYIIQMRSQVEIQLGKKGLTKELLEEIKKRFEKSHIKNILLCKDFKIIYYLF